MRESAVPVSVTLTSLARAVCLACVGLSLLASAGVARAQVADFSFVVSLGDSLFDNPQKQRSPLIPEHITARVGAPLTQLARGGATTATLLSQNQHTRAVALGARLAFVWIGGNDFLANQANIAANNLTFLIPAEANLRTALQVLTDGGVRQIVLFNLPDFASLPVVVANATSPVVLARFRAASFNWRTRLFRMADDFNQLGNQVLVIDVFAFSDAIRNNPDAFTVLGQRLVLAPVSGLISDPDPARACPLCAFADPIHPSSVSMGFLANRTIAAMNEFFGTAITRMSPAELDSLVRDADGDVLNDVVDNCRFRSNFPQLDRGGAADATDPLGSRADGIGDACQCGDMSGDGRATMEDARVLMRCFLNLDACQGVGLGGLPAAALDRCGVGGNPGCDSAEPIILLRSSLGLPPRVRQECPAAVGP